MPPRAIQIEQHLIGSERPPFIVAELSANHNGSLQRALDIVEAVADAGAHAIKLQTYTADTMTLDLAIADFQIGDASSPWQGRSLHSLYAEAHTPWNWHEEIFRRARDLGLVVFSTPFDQSAVDFLEKLHVAVYKIASFELVDLPLIRHAAATGKPLIMSTGMATVEEIEDAVAASREAGCKDLILLKCTSSYPASARTSNLRAIPELRAGFDCHVGLSDHTLGTVVAVAGVALGACMIEKHVTMSRADGGVDAGFSLEPSELKTLVNETHTAWESLGSSIIGPAESEMSSRQLRRSLYICEDLQAGDVVTRSAVRAIRPGSGLPPKFLDAVIGKTLSRAVRRGTPVSWDLFH